jgi:hypothetical protein
MDQLIYIIGSATLFLNKVLLYRKDKRGWLWGIVGVILLTIPTYQNKLWVNTGFHVGLVFLMTYGYLLTHSYRNLIPKALQLRIKVSIIFATIIFCFYLFFKIIL